MAIKIKNNKTNIKQENLNQTKPNQSKPNQAKPNQTKSKQHVHTKARKSCKQLLRILKDHKLKMGKICNHTQRNVCKWDQ